MVSHTDRRKKLEEAIAEVVATGASLKVIGRKHGIDWKDIGPLMRKRRIRKPPPLAYRAAIDATIAGAKVEDAANQYGVSPGVISYWRCKLGASERYSKQPVDKAVDLVLAGKMNAAQAAKKTGALRASVSRRLVIVGVRQRPFVGDIDLYRKAWQLRQQGLTHKQIGEAIGKSPLRVSSLISGYAGLIKSLGREPEASDLGNRRVIRSTPMDREKKLVKVLVGLRDGLSFSAVARSLGYKNSSSLHSWMAVHYEADRKFIVSSLDKSEAARIVLFTRNLKVEANDHE